jgi:hypothetical protein
MNKLATLMLTFVKPEQAAWGKDLVPLPFT